MLAHHIRITVIDPDHPTVHLEPSLDVTLTAIVRQRGRPSAGPTQTCSIGLRIDYGASAILFTGDAEALEEVDLPIGGPVTLLQVGHHGSHTASSEALLDQAAPKYAVISAGHPAEGTNRTYCHPRAETVHALTARLGGPGSGQVHAFPSAESCNVHTEAALWVDAPASDRLWATSRDGEVVLTTTGDGAFSRE